MPSFFLQEAVPFILVGVDEPPPSWDPVSTPDFGMCMHFLLSILESVNLHVCAQLILPLIVVKYSMPHYFLYFILIVLK
jgi:hypothetical protein